jgi:ABC-type polysaccharide/polyol phosphate transport system ATPase subunit
VNAVEVANVSKHYELSGSQFTRLRRLMAPGQPRDGEGLWAVRNVSFSVERGEAFGIIGANGSGKSTLLQIIAGILRPTSGTVTVNGRLAALLELGSGFSPEFTGRDNVYLNGSLLGLSREEIDARFDDIERFAGIGDFIDQPIKTYSTGMVLRLAFAVSAHVDPDVLIVDEALAVGDISFRQRCMRRIHELRARGVTILFVSHETSDVKALCERCLWLQDGMTRQLGEADGVVAKYLSATLEKEISHARASHATGPAKEHAGPRLAQEDAGFAAAFQGHRYGDGRATILSGTLAGPSGRQIRLLTPLEHVVLRVAFQVKESVDSPIAGFLVRNSRGENIFGSNTARENYPLPPLAAGEKHTVDFHWTAPDLAPGKYHVSLAIADGDVREFTLCDYVEDAIEVNTAARPAVQGGTGYFQLQCARVALHRNQGRDSAPRSAS